MSAGVIILVVFVVAVAIASAGAIVLAAAMRSSQISHAVKEDHGHE